MNLHPKFTVKDLDSFGVIDYVKGMSTNKKLLAGGAALGGVKTVMDDTDDNLQSTAVKASIGAGITWGGAQGVKYIAKRLDESSAKSVVSQQEKKSNDINRETSRVEAEAQSTKVSQNLENTSKVTSSKINKVVEVEGEANKSLVDQAKVKKMKNWLGKAKVAGAIGLGAFAVASVMDTSQTMSEKREVSRMTEKQERNLNRKLKREEKNQSQYAYGHVDFGQMAIDMFNERTGHHKMGNSKFQ